MDTYKMALDALFLTKSILDRPLDIEAINEEEIEFAIQRHHQESSSNKLTVQLSVQLTLKHHKDFRAFVEMTGIFHYEGELPFSIADFASVNGPAILFPFVREHLAALTSKAGLNTVLLPPLNFVSMAEEDKKKPIE